MNTKKLFWIVGIGLCLLAIGVGTMSSLEAHETGVGIENDTTPTPRQLRRSLFERKAVLVVYGATDKALAEQYRTILQELSKSRESVDAAGVPPLLVRPLGQFILVGKTEPTQLVEILARKELASERQTELCLRFTEALDALKQSRLAQACELFEAILQDYPDDGPSRFHLSRCRTLQNQESPSQQLDVVLMDSK